MDPSKILLNEMGWKGVAWAEWKAAALNQLFEEQGVMREARIKAATVLHGEHFKVKSDAR